MDYARLQNVTRAPAKAAPLLTAEDGQRNQDRPRLRFKNVVVK